MIGPYVRKNWDALTSKKKLKFRFAAWDRLETVGFSLKMKKKTTVNGKKAILMELTPTSFVIALIVNPIKLYFSRDGDHPLLLVDGRMAIKGERRGRMFDLVGKMTFSDPTHPQKPTPQKKI